MDTVYNRTNDGKEVVATHITDLQPDEDVAEVIAEACEAAEEETEGEKES